jgi:adenosylmethionine-8-amino-7-oxononanoate aminotransferase
VTDVALFKDTYAPLLQRSVQVTSPDWRLAARGESPHDYALRCALDLERYLAAHHPATAALIVEPLVQGATGMAMYHAQYLARAREICHRYDVHLIADEIMTGFGRTGTFFAHEQAAIAPDFLCLSKGITGGYLPLSVVMTRDRIYEAFYDDSLVRGFLHSHSYTGNALACRAALATLAIFESDDVLEANRHKAATMNALSTPLAEHRRVRDFRNTGMIWAFEVDAPGEGLSRRVFEAALERELLLRPIGNTVYFMPPYTISEDELAMLVDRTVEIVDAL